MCNTLSITGCIALVLAAGASAQAAATSGLLVLNTSAKGALTVTGGANVQVPSITVNSKSTTAVSVGNNSVLDSASLQVVGGSNTNSSTLTGTMSKIALPVVDPLAGLSFKMPILPDQGTKTYKGKNITVAPGYYSGGITISSGATVSFQPGVYYLGGKGLVASSCTIVGTDVAFVIQAGAVNIGSGSSVNLVPMSSGTYAGIIVAQNPTDTNKVTLNGGAGMQISGTIYAPTANINITGGSTITGSSAVFGTQVIGSTITLTGKGTITFGNPVPPPPNNLTPLVPPAITGLFD